MKQQLPILIIMAVGALCACTNPFTTRAGEVEKPNLSTFIYQSYDQYDHVIENFRIALKDKNATEYMNCLSQEPSRYYYIPEATYAEEFRAHHWLLEDERAFYDNFKSNSASVSFVFDQGLAPLKPIFGTSLDDSVESELTHYKMTVNFNVDSLKIFEGLMRFKLYHDHEQQRWHIYYWEDKAVDNRFDYTFTSLKSAFLKSTNND